MNIPDTPPPCPICHQLQTKTVMIIVDGLCWKCGSTMKVAFYRIAGATIGPSCFKKEEIDFAKSKGVIIEDHYSFTAEENYLASTCSTCSSFAGDSFLFTQYAFPASLGELSSTSYEVGFHCEHCYPTDQNISMERKIDREALINMLNGGSLDTATIINEDFEEKMFLLYKEFDDPTLTGDKFYSAVNEKIASYLFSTYKYLVFTPDEKIIGILDNGRIELFDATDCKADLDL